jgi:hypothetical protein
MPLKSNILGSLKVTILSFGEESAQTSDETEEAAVVPESWSHTFDNGFTSRKQNTWESS